MYQPFDLTGLVAVVTGGGRGIGLDIARGLSAAGATVVIAEIDPVTGAAAAAEVGGHSVVLNVLDSEMVETTLRQIAATHGSLDIIVNNAGIARNMESELETDEGWRKVLAMNLDAVFYCCRSAGNIMLEQGKGSIVNIASMSGLIVNRPQPQVAYNVSKAGVIMLTKSMAAEWAPRGVRVNCISPGYVRTNMLIEVETQMPERLAAWTADTPMGRLAKPEEIAPAAVFLASPGSSYVTGSNVVVDGGFTAW